MRVRWLRYWRIRFRRRFLRPLRHFNRTVERFAGDILYDRSRSPMAVGVGAVLHLLSFPFRLLVYLRHLCYLHRILRPQYLGCTVVTVGNLTVGGTGKTPIVELLARELARRGRRVAILSRGYRSRSQPPLAGLLRLISHRGEPPPRIVGDGRSVLLDSAVAGDEPHMLAKNLPGVVVLTDKNRVRAGHFAIKHFGCDVLLLDDGFQYRRLHGHLNLLLIDSTRPFGGGKLLPRGILREPPSAMVRATHILLTKSDGAMDPAREAALVRHAGPGIPILRCRHAPRTLCCLQGDGDLPIAFLFGKKVALFSGIASPDGFEAFVHGTGASVVLRRHFPDHYRFSEEDVQKIFGRACERGAELVLTTEKDAVRLESRWIYPLPTYYLRIEMEILHGREHFEALLQRICAGEANGTVAGAAAASCDGVFSCPGSNSA
ncbi:MAG: tetraacyldisaccharide 4'-kinase [Puniceicoccales bacterium]|nr:tetraacyldisaccharide 4'-kinase [Puniceicoccales bacterium]